MLRLASALLLVLSGPVTAQPPAWPPDPNYVPPPCDHLYQLYFLPGSVNFDRRAEAIAEIFGRSHAWLGTRVRLVVWRGAGANLITRRLVAVRTLLERFHIPHDRTEVELQDAGKEYYLRDVISLVEIVPPAEMERRRAAYPSNVVC